MSMVIVKQGEQVPKFVKVDGLVVTRQHVTEHGKLGNVLVKWSFDFTDVSPTDLMVLASRSVLIGVRPKFKKTSNGEAEAWNNRTIKVKEYLEGAREVLSTEEKARRVISTMSADQKAKLIAELQASL